MPLSNQIHVDKALSNLSVAFRNPSFIASQAVPELMVQHESDKFYVYDRSNLRNDGANAEWADGARAHRASYNLSTATYTLKRFGLEEQVTDRAKANADKALSLEADATELLTDRILLQMEKDFADKVMTAANLSGTTSLSSTQAWSQDTTLSNPIAYAHSAGTAVAAASGRLPNLCVLPHGGFVAASDHTSVRDRVKYVSSESVGESMLAKLFDVEKVLVGRAVLNSAEEDLADSVGFLYTDNAFFAFMGKPSLKSQSAMLRFRKSQGGLPMKVEKYREEETESTIVRVSSHYEHRWIDTSSAYMIVNIL